MIKLNSSLYCIDNSGAVKVQAIRLLGGSSRKTSSASDVIVVSIKKVIPHKKVQKGSVFWAIVTRLNRNVMRDQSGFLRFTHNCVVLVNKKFNPVGSRVFGPVYRELRERGFLKIVSMASVCL
jgi:large subunit ribosomal protein L14